MTLVDPSRCPRCGEPNDCQLAAGRTRCWCFEMSVSSEALEKVPTEARDVACLCRRCANGTTDEAQRRKSALRWLKR
ncbi:MAG TPA: cysteine-rich CWC family protein [Kofleriaceae bacterium]|nr:cysteine-rich CWC family protein [Kofleriaceae bacterium]